MRLIDRILQFLRKKRSPEAIQSASSDFKALQSDTTALQQRSKALEYSLQALESAQTLERLQSIEEKSHIEPEMKKIELQTESLQLGVAAGYVGRSLREIENSLIRIESQMITKDWFSMEVKEKILKLLEIAKKHEEEEEERFKALQSALSNLRSLAGSAPEPIKSEMFKQIETIESKLPLTSKMMEVLQILKETKKISYNDLSKRLGISVSSLRGLLTNMARRTSEIERITKDGQGWVRLRSN